MSLTLEYSNDWRSYMAQQMVLAREQWALAKSNHYRVLALQCAILIAAIYSAYAAELIALVFLFFVCLAALVAASFPYSKRVSAAMKAVASQRAPKQVKLVVDDTGLHETVEGIESFAPWSSIVSFGTQDDVLLVELKAGLWALIPRYSLNEPAALDALVQQLRQRGVSERPIADA